MVHPTNKSGGFSLVETMVGMVMGLITLVIIMQSYAAFEGQKRTTTNGADAQENGLVSIRAIETDVRMSGAGLVSSTGLSCSSMNWYYNGITGTSPLAPVTIGNGAAGAPDTISVSYSNSSFNGSPAMLTADMPTSGTTISLDTINLSGFRVNLDKFIVSTPSALTGGLPCSRLAYVDTTVSNPSSSALALFNPPSSVNIFPSGAITGYSGFNSFAINMGDFIQNQYAVINGDLTVTDISLPGQASLSLSSNIVNIQAQYGVAPTNLTPGSPAPAVSCWTDAAGSNCNPSSGDWSAPNTADILRIKAIRVAVVARSSLQEKGGVNGCTTTVVAPVSWVGGPVIDLSADPNWRCHRYSVYQTIIPLRNVIWSNL